METAVITIEAYLNSAWVDITSDTHFADGEWGINGNSEVDLITGIGTLEMELKNHNPIGKYTFGHSNMTSGWKRGVPIRQVFTYENQDYVRFRGYLEDAEDAGALDKRKRITVLDWMIYASRATIKNATLLEDVTADEIATSVLDYIEVTPQNVDFEEGLNTFQTGFDAVNAKTKALNEFTRTAMSEFAHFYLKKDKTSGETLRLENLTTRNGYRQPTEFYKPYATRGRLKKVDGSYLLKVDGGKILLQDYTSLSLMDSTSVLDYEVTDGDNTINEASVTASPKRTDENSVLIYQTEQRIFIPTGGRVEFRGFYTNPEGKNKIHSIPVSSDGYTKLLVHFDDLDLPFYPTTINDAIGNVITNVNGDNQMEYTIVKMGKGSIYLDGTASYLTIPDSPGWDLGTIWTVEWWEYRITSTSGQAMFSRDGTDAVPSYIFGRSNGASLLIDISSDGITNDIANGKTLGAITLNTWNHFEVSRNGSNFYAFKNGVLTDSWTSSATIYNASTPLYIGLNNGSYMNAVLDEIRIMNGRVAHTAAFTPETEPYSLSGSYYDLRPNQDGTGTDLTANLEPSVTYGTESATWIFENNSTSDGWLNISLYGRGIYSDSRIEVTHTNDESVEAYGIKSVSVHQEYQQDSFMADIISKKIVALDRNPRKVLNTISMTANKSADAMLAFLNLDVGDVLHVENTDKEIDRYYYIQGIKYQSQPAGILNFQYTLKESFSLYKGSALMACEFRGGANADGINFGYLPHVSAQQNANRVFSAWVYLDTVPTTELYSLFSTYNVNSGVLFYIIGSAGTAYLRAYSSLHTVSGQWTSNTGVATGGWRHLLMVHDVSSVTNDPVFYIDGVLVASTENVTPSGSLKEERGILTLGNTKNAGVDWIWALDGKMKDARIYNMDENEYTNAELASGLYAEGAGGTAYLEGCKFQAFAVREEEETSYTDLALTADNALLDVYGGFAGIPNGSPIARAI